jgi:putative membrane protein
MRIHNQKMDLLSGTLLLRPYVFLFLVGFLVAAGRDLGPGRTLLFGALVWPLAWLSEFSSTRVGIPFGLYHYTGLTRGRELYIADVPFFDSLSFTFLAYAAFCLARRVLTGRAASPGATALLSGFLMMMLDVVIDPAAVRGERWFLGHLFYYPQGGVYFGVPLSNFAGWWLVGAVGVGAFLACAGARHPSGAGRVGAGIALYYAVLGFNLAVTAWIGEWGSLAVGVVLHGFMAIALVAIVRRAPVGGVLGTGGVQQA